QDATYQGTDHTVAQFVGTFPAYVSAANYHVATGAVFTDQDVAEARKVVLIGPTVVEDMFGSVDPIGKQIVVSGKLFTVIGVLADRGTAGFADPNDIAIAPISAVQEPLTGFGPLNQILVQATGPDDVTDAQAEITAILNQQL